MKFIDILKLNIKKLKVKPKKATFLIIPVLILIALSVVVSSQIENINKALEKSVFDTISDQYTLLTVNVAQEENEFDPSQMMRDTSSVEESRFTSTDEEVIAQITGVSSANVQTVVPITNIFSNDLFDGKEITLSNLTTLDSTAASLYTDSDFTYTEGVSIPIILNSSSFVYSYEDWSDGDTITIDRSSFKPGEGGQGTNRLSFLKSENIEYDKDSLIGTEFTISFGGLDDIQDYETSREDSVTNITKLSEDELQEKIDEREDAISEYWDYEKISAPVTYTFVVVGIIEDESNRASYIPSAFADVVMESYISNEINARVDDIPTDVLNSDFLGLTYDGEEVSSGGSSMFGQMIRRAGEMCGEMGARPSGDGEAPDMSSFNGYTIPGLVIEVDDENEVVGAIEDSSIYSSSTKYGDSISVVVDSVTDRDSVVEALNDAGYAYQDVSDLEVFDKLEDTLNTISNGFLISFIVLVASIVVLTMSKLVSESVREIGIFRAIGMRKGSVLMMFVSQSILYVAIGCILGIVLGSVLNFGISGLINSWFSTFINDTVSETFNVVNSVDSSVFLGINWISIGIYSLLLFIISLVVSIIPSMNASNISPVEAIKGE